MANKSETGRKAWDIQSLPAEGPTSASQLQENAIELSSFLSDLSIHNVTVDSVIPSTVLGIMYSVSVERIVGVSQEGNHVSLVHKTNNASIRLLEISLDLMSKKKRKKHKQLAKNLKMITQAVADSANWKAPFNVRRDN